VTARYDVVVLGGDVESLVAAGYLAKAGRSVLVLEGRDHLGGSLVTTEPVSGFRFDACEHFAAAIAPAVVDDLALGHHGLRHTVADPLVIAARPEGPPIRLIGDPNATARGLASVAPEDAASWPGFAKRIQPFIDLLTRIYTQVPPQPGSTKPADLGSLLHLALRARGLGKTELFEFLRTFPMPVADLLDDWFSDDALKGALGALAVRHLAQGPRGAGTAFGLFHHLAGSATVPRGRPIIQGGVGHLAWALEVSARSRGVEIRTGVAVDRIQVVDRSVAGVRLAGGETVQASVVLSGHAPRKTFLELLDAEVLDPEFVTDVERIRYRGVAAKVNLALAEVPQFTGFREEDLRGVIMLSPSLDHVEQAFDHTKYGEQSGAPVLEVVVPSVLDPSLAPEGRHVMSVWVHFAPYHLRGAGWDDQAREALADSAIEMLGRYAPNLPGGILHREALTPVDLEERFGAPEGQINHGELTLDQILFMRPVPGWSRYDTPVRGLYVCGLSTHPGGGLTGQSGALAARRVLRSRP
jgi:phytoene dehydrogenase-like protein